MQWRWVTALVVQPEGAALPPPPPTAGEGSAGGERKEPVGRTRTGGFAVLPDAGQGISIDVTWDQVRALPDLTIGFQRSVLDLAVSPGHAGPGSWWQALVLQMLRSDKLRERLFGLEVLALVDKEHAAAPCALAQLCAHREGATGVPVVWGRLFVEEPHVAILSRASDLYPLLQKYGTGVGALNSVARSACVSALWLAAVGDKADRDAAAATHKLLRQLLVNKSPAAGGPPAHVQVDFKGWRAQLASDEEQLKNELYHELLLKRVRRVLVSDGDAQPHVDEDDAMGEALGAPGAVGDDSVSNGAQAFDRALQLLLS